VAKPITANRTKPQLSLVPSPSAAMRRTAELDDEDDDALAPPLPGDEGLGEPSEGLEPGEDLEGEPGEAGELAKVDERPPLSPAAKAGIAAGVGVGVGALGFGVYQLGKWAGWWGSSAIVIDDVPKPSPKGDDRPNDGGGGGGGGGSGSGRARGNPPNVTGDRLGYNSTLYPAPLPVRVALKAIGYDVEISSKSLYENSQPHPIVSTFQTQWNGVIKAIDAGRISLPSSPAESKWVDALRGVLEVDGIAGKRTLCALEIALTNQVRNGLGWQGLVGKA
jgi:hypothetical protein